MRVQWLLLLLCVMVAGQSPEDLQVIISHSDQQMEEIMKDSARVTAIVDCVVEVADCSTDPLALPMYRSIRSWVASQQICSFCKAEERMKVEFILTQLTLQYPDQFIRIIQHYKLTP